MAARDPFAAFEFMDEAPGTSGPSGDPVQHRRETLIKAIDDQIALHQDPTYAVKKYVKRSDPESGRMFNVKEEKSPRRWWKEVDGAVYLRPKYGPRDLELKPGKPVVKLHIDQVETFLSALKEEVEKGRLDGRLEELSFRVGRKR